MEPDEKNAALERHYWCFISYRHTDNKEEGRQWANWLHQALETYEVPKDLVGKKNDRGEVVPSRIFPVFRDEVELGTGSLSERINKALDHSKTLVVICSPRVLESTYVSDEIRRFKRLGKASYVYAVVVDGEPGATLIEGGKCFPDELRYELDAVGQIQSERPAEPLAGDFRLDDGTQGWTTPEAYEQHLKREGGVPASEIAKRVKTYAARLELGKLKLISGVLGIPLGTLQKRDKAYQLQLARRRARIFAGVLTGMSVLAGLAVAGAIFGWIQTKRATAERDTARFNDGQGALLRSQVAEQDGNCFPDQLFHAARASGFEGFGRSEATPASASNPWNVIREWIPMLDSKEDRFPVLVPTKGSDRCREILNRGAYLPFWKTAATGSAAISLSYSYDGRRVAASFKDGSIRLWDFKDADLGKSVPVTLIRPTGSSPARMVIFDARGNLSAATEQGVLIWTTTEAQPSVVLPGNATAMAWKADGSLLAAGFADGSSQLWNPADSSIRPSGKHEAAVNAIAFSADQVSLATGAEDGSLRIWNLDGRERMVLIEGGPPVTALSVSPNRNLYATIIGNEASVRLWNNEGLYVLPLPSSKGKQTITTAVGIRPDGKLIASGHGTPAEAKELRGCVKLWTVSENGLVLEVATLVNPGEVCSLDFAPAGNLLAVGLGDGTLLAWDLGGIRGDMAKPNLRAYFDSDWYQFDTKQEVVCSKGGGQIINLPETSSTGIWARNELDRESTLFRYLVEAQDWNRATAFLVGKEDRGYSTATLAQGLITEAKKSQDAYDWNMARWRLAQLERLGPLSPELKSSLEKVQANVISPEMPRSFANGDGMEMIWCPPGIFPMGSLPSEVGRGEDERIRLVQLTQGFWISKFEVTQNLWQRLMRGSNPSNFRSSGLNAPVEQVSWKDAMEFCSTLSERESFKGAIPDGWEYTLPTEAQWEYACRAGNYKVIGVPPGLGDTSKLDEYAWYLENSELRTHDVGTKKPNDWGIFDMRGNIGEWCRDWYSTYTYAPAMTDPVGYEEWHERAIRGGSWDGTSSSCRPAYRHWGDIDFRSSYVGFRPVLSRKNNRAGQKLDAPDAPLQRQRSENAE